ncbi:MAG TPA: 50S ribosomal protein L19e [Methanomicrobiales archaeon]|nr:50S ribosomal protein L19e [Methanomicrobiales archaeon]
MSNLSNQKRLAASVLGCGVNRIWFDPGRAADVEGAISRDDLRTLITEGVVRAKQKKGVSRGRARERDAKRAYGHRRGPGKRRGAAGARRPSKTQWVQRIRAIRKTMRALRDEGQIDPHLYRILYRKASGGQFRSIAHMKSQVGIQQGKGK